MKVVGATEYALNSLPGRNCRDFAATWKDDQKLDGMDKGRPQEIPKITSSPKANRCIKASD